MGKGVRHGVCSADIGGVAGQEHTGVEREQGARVPRRKEPSSKGSSLRPRPLPQERRAVVVRGGGGGLQGLWVREVRGGRDVVPLFHMGLHRRPSRGETRPPRVRPPLGGDALTGGVAGVQEELPP